MKGLHNLKTQPQTGVTNERPETVTATHRVLEDLRRRIIRAEIQPGVLLLESELAKEYGVSKTPAREALQILAAEELVTVIPRRGYYVSTVSFDSFRDAMDLRLMLEPPITATAALRHNPDELFELRRQLEIQFDVDSSLGERLEAATAFHRGCVKASGNMLAYSLTDKLFISVQRLHHLNHEVESHFRSESEQDAHYGILEAIEARDAEKAQSRMHDHLVESNNAIAMSFMSSQSWTGNAR